MLTADKGVAMRGRHMVLAAVLPVVVVASGTAGAAAAPDHHARPARVAALRQAIAELAAMPGGPPGVAVVVQRERARHFYHGGVAVIGGRAPRITDHMRIASVAKAFSGATALVLVDHGVLHLRDTIGHWLPGLPNKWHRVTLRELLQHASGLPDFTKSPKFVHALLASPHHAPRPRTLLGYVRNKPLDFPAGTEYRYSNSDNIAVGLMIQKATGRSYNHELRHNVLRPLHLRQTSLPRGIRMPRTYIHGYARDEKTNRITDDVSHLAAAGWSWASGGVVSTPADLNRFIRGYVSGRLISAHTRKVWHRLLIPGGGSDPRGPGFNSAGMALFRYQTSCGTVYGHTGNIFGYTQFAVSTRDGSRSATITINSQVTQKSKGQQALVFAGLRRVVQAAVCTATG
jgi:D-alanyl-D-alanine carboxypeptidase